MNISKIGCLVILIIGIIALCYCLHHYVFAEIYDLNAQYAIRTGLTQCTELIDGVCDRDKAYSPVSRRGKNTLICFLWGNFILVVGSTAVCSLKFDWCLQAVILYGFAVSLIAVLTIVMYIGFSNLGVRQQLERNACVNVNLTETRYGYS